jgi:hypothetical protein
MGDIDASLGGGGCPLLVSLTSRTLKQLNKPLMPETKQTFTARAGLDAFATSGTLFGKGPTGYSRV